VVVARSNAREVLHASVAPIIIGVLYRYWLIAPVLHWLSALQWRVVAILVAVLIGGLFSVLRVPLAASVCACVAGLLLGGAWAAWWAPNDVRVSFIGVFWSHLQLFWWDVVVLTIAVGVGGICSRAVGVLRKRRSMQA
jgi:hypothetical protein